MAQVGLAWLLSKGDVTAPIVGATKLKHLEDAIGALDDCEATLRHLHKVIGPHTRIVIAYFAPVWEPLLAAAERLGEKI